MDNVLRPFATRLPGTVLSSTQQLVSRNLAPIFSFYTKTQLDAVVLFQSSHYIQPVSSQVLLQRCIDFILDNPDQLEAVVSKTGTAGAGACKTADVSVIDVFSDDDDIELLGAVSSFEDNLHQKDTDFKTQSDSGNLAGPYTDDLPILSSPRHKRQESRNRDEITISDSPTPTSSQNCVSISSTEDVSASGVPSESNNNKQDENFHSDCELPRKADEDFGDDEDSLPDLDSLFAKIDKTKACVTDTKTSVGDPSKSNSSPISTFENRGSKNAVPEGAIVIKSANKIKTDVIQTCKPTQTISASCSNNGANTKEKPVVNSPVKAITGIFASLRPDGNSSKSEPQAAVNNGSAPTVKTVESLSSSSGTAKSPFKLFRHEIEDRGKNFRDVFATFKEDCSTMLKHAFARESNEGTSVKAASTVQASNETGALSASSIEVKGMVYYSAMRQSSQGFLPGRLRLESFGAQWKASVYLEGKQEADLMFMLEQRSIKSLIDWNEGLVLELESGSMVKLIIDPPQTFQLKIVNKVLARIKDGKYAAKQSSSSTATSTGHTGTEVKNVTANRNLSNSFGLNSGVQVPAKPSVYPGVTKPSTSQLGQIANIPLPPEPPRVNYPHQPLPVIKYPHPHRPDTTVKPTVLPNPPPVVTYPAPPVNNPPPPKPAPPANNPQPPKPPPPPNIDNPPPPPNPPPPVINYPHPPPRVVHNQPPPPPVVNNPPPPPPVVNNPPPPPPVVNFPPPNPPATVVTIPSSPTPPPEPPAVKTPEQQLEEWKLEVLDLFPQVELGFLEGRLRAHYGRYAVNNVCSELLEMPDYPKSHIESTITVEKPKAKEDSVDYYKDYEKVTLSTQDTTCSLALLKEEFRRVSARDISDVWSFFSGHYAPAYKALEEAMLDAYSKKDQASSGTSTSRMPYSVKQINVRMKHGSKEKVIVSQLLKCGRQKRSLPYMSILVNKEVEFVKMRKTQQKEKEDYEMAWKLNEEQYEEDGQTIECGCCFCEYPFESMVQCTEGHLFCTTCLLSYAKEAVFGSGKLNLSCMTDGCEATYPQSEMKRAVPSEILCQYEDRVREENLNLADLSDLVRCPHCNYAAIMDVEGDKVFRCQNKECMKETCRLCKEDWTDHIGLPCEKVEKKDETKLRKEYEEKMTEAKVRTCHRCKSKYMKEEGCNKMTCTCRASMCYICRAPNIDYNHFCRHPRDPGKLCTECKACSLWTNPDEDDKRAIEEIRKEGQEKRKEKGFEDDKTIGAPTEPPAKKHRRR